MEYEIYSRHQMGSESNEELEENHLTDKLSSLTNRIVLSLMAQLKV